MPGPAARVVEPDQDRVVPLPEVDACIVCGALTTDPRYEFSYVPLDQARAVCYCEKDSPGDTAGASIIAHTHLLMKGVPDLQGARMQVFHASQSEQVKQAALFSYQQAHLSARAVKRKRVVE